MPDENEYVDRTYVSEHALIPKEDVYYVLKELGVRMYQFPHSSHNYYRKVDADCAAKAIKIGVKVTKKMYSILLLFRKKRPEGWCADA